MDAKELAALLNGREYRHEMTTDDDFAARDAGLVVVFGASDDLMEFRGVIWEEVGADNGTEVRIDAKGLIPDFDEIMSDKPREAKELLRDYFQRETGGKTIEVLWDSKEPYSWTYKTDIPHETFDIMEDGEPYCRGIVFRLADAG